MTRPALLALAALLLLPGCGLQGEQTARPLQADSAEPQLTSTATPQPEGQQSERLYLVREGRLVPVERQTRTVSPSAALTDLLAGPTAEDAANDLTSAVPTAADFALTGVEAGIAVVELPGDLGEIPRNDQVLALAQVVATLDSAPGVTGVRFTQDGEPVEVPDASAALRAVPVTLEDYRSLLAG